MPNKYKILLADDYDFFRAALTDVLTVAGYSVVEAANGNEAIKLYETEKPDAIITDISILK